MLQSRLPRLSMCLRVQSTGCRTSFSTSALHPAYRPGVKPSADIDFNPSDTPAASGIKTVLKWWRQLRPLKEEWQDFVRRARGNTAGMDRKIPQLTRYFVRFPFLTDLEFAAWKITTDSMLGQGYSWAEFVRSPCQAPGCARPLLVDRPDDSFSPELPDPQSAEGEHHSFSRTYPMIRPRDGPHPGSREAQISAVTSSITDMDFKGYGLFRGFISTRVPARGDLRRAGFANLRSPQSCFLGFVLPYPMFSYTHLAIRYRGDGRAYRINLLPRQLDDSRWFLLHHFVLYTRGGPYWQVAKIPLSKFFELEKGTVRLSQQPVDKNDVRLLSFTLMDNIDGPFSLELDYIALYCDIDHNEKFAYEQYDRVGILQ